MYEPYPDYLLHYGVLGMHWGVRRYQPYTNGQKGTFLNLRKKYKGEVKSLKRESRKSGDPLIKDANKQRIKEAKSRYKAELKSLKSKYDLDNYEAYKQKVVETGSEKEIRKLRRELTPAQLRYATERIKAKKDFEASKGINKIKNDNEKLKAQIDRINLKKQLSQAKLYDPKKEKKAKEKAAKAAAKAALKNAKKESVVKKASGLLKALAKGVITVSTLSDLVVLSRQDRIRDEKTGRVSSDTYSALTGLSEGKAPKYGKDKEEKKKKEDDDD